MNLDLPQRFNDAGVNELFDILKEDFSDVVIKGQKNIRYQVKTVRNRAGQLVETILLQRGIRKIPFSIQDGIMYKLIGRPIYPEAQDFELVDVKAEVLKCQTFFAICQAPRLFQ